MTWWTMGLIVWTLLLVRSTLRHRRARREYDAKQLADTNVMIQRLKDARDKLRESADVKFEAAADLRRANVLYGKARDIALRIEKMFEPPAKPKDPPN